MSDPFRSTIASDHWRALLPITNRATYYRKRLPENRFLSGASMPDSLTRKACWSTKMVGVSPSETLISLPTNASA